MKGRRTAYLFWLLSGFGILGLHRLYLGRWVTFLVWLLTGGLCLVGAVIDFFFIPRMVEVENLARHLMTESLRRNSRAGPALAGEPGG